MATGILSKLQIPPSLSNMQAGNAKMGSSGLGSGISLSSINTPQGQLPSNIKPGGVMSTDSYNKAVSMGMKANSPETNSGIAPTNGLASAYISPTQTTTAGSQQQTQPGAGGQGGMTSAVGYGTPSAGGQPTSAVGYGTPTTGGQLSPAGGGITTGTQGGTSTPGQPPTFGGILGQLSQTSTQGSPQVQAAQQNLLTTQTNVQNAMGGIASEPIPIEFQQGRQALLSNLGTQQIANANDQVKNALTGQGQQITGLSSAANSAAPSGTYPFAFDPIKGQFSNAGGSGAGGGMTTPQQAAQALNAGTMSTDQAAAALSYLGSSAQSQLVSAMGQINPSFNWNQAQQNAATQGTIGPQASLATQVLNNLQNTLNSVPAWQNTTSPVINYLGKLVNWSGIAGSGAQQNSQELTNAINEARGAVSTALGTAYSTTPTAFTGMVDSWFPDNPTPAQVQAGINEFSALMSARSQSFGSPGTISLPNNGTSNSNIYTW